MSLKLVINSADPPVGALAVVEILRPQLKSDLQVVWSNDFGKNVAKLQFLENDEKVLGEKDTDVARYLSRAKNAELYGSSDPFERTEVDHWLTFAERPFNQINKIENALSYLDEALTPRTWLVAKHLTIADICVFSKINFEVQIDLLKEKYPNVFRWYKQMLSLPEIEKVITLIAKNRTKDLKTISNKTSTGPPKETGKRKQEGKFIDLPGAEIGKVVVRFPPEASGYLHIGHAKAALLNQYYAENFKGTLIMRFDDTNPAKENVEFEKAILEDLEMLQIKPDRFTHSSDYFDLMLEYCEKLIKEGHAYVDNTPAAQMKEQRDQKLPSANRCNTVEKNMELWKEMVQGTEKGQECCVRAKIDYQSANGCMRDPTIYRCKPEPHPRTGTKYKVYPTYDFACPIVDAVENVTHTLRTTEYHDRDEQFYWFINMLKLNKPYIWEYSRLNMTNTVLSKRKLTWFVAESLVDGWDDPRFPTVRGILRRGMTVEGLKQFIIAQGSSRSVVFMEWDKIWAFNKKVIDPIAVRYTALTAGDTVKVNVKGATDGFREVANHPKNPSCGTKRMRFGPTILIEEEDAEALKEGQNATFINWGNLLIEKIRKENDKVIEVDASLNLDNTDFKNTLKLTWIAADTPEIPRNCTGIPCYTVYFDHIITKPVLGKDDDFKNFVGKDTRREIEMLGEAELRRVKKGEIIQLQRKGFFRCDVPYAEPSVYSGREQPLILFHIPDGHVTIPLPGAADKTVINETKEVTKAQGSSAELNEQIIAQGNKIRDLKSTKADKSTIDAEVKLLLELKHKYKDAAGIDWKPNATPPAKTLVDSKSSDSAVKVSEEIVAQGNKVRDLKSSKAEKAKIEVEVKFLIDLKAKYKSLTGQDWKPGANPPASSNSPDLKSSDSAAKVSEEIIVQGNKVRDLKSSKAEKTKIEAELKLLLDLKAKYKSLTGQDWKPGANPPAQSNSSDSKSSDSAAQVSEEIIVQGNKVRDLKSSKAEKTKIEAELKLLLDLKAKYKTLTGQDWKPGANPLAPSNSPDLKSSDSAAKVSEEIIVQGNKVRDLKSSKAEKTKIEAELKLLLDLKAKYKSLTGQDWKPGANPPAQSNSSDSKSSDSAAKVNEELVAQGHKVEVEVKYLEDLKAKYKSLTGQDWKPGATTAPTKSTLVDNSKAFKLSNEIKKQGDAVRDLKSKKPSAEIIAKAVAKLLELKAEYKKLTGEDWTPAATVAQNSETADVQKTDKMSNPQMNDDSNIQLKIVDQGNKVRDLKAAKADKAVIKQEVDSLLALKDEYKKIFGKDYAPSANSGSARETKSKPGKTETAAKAVNKVAKKPESSKESPKDGDSSKTGTRLGLEAKKNENLSDWYSQVVTKGEMIEYYHVSGCYILRPWSYSIWDIIKDFFDKKFNNLGVRNCAFPIFVGKAVLEKEKTHIEDFSPEVAWVTKSGDTDLAEPIAIRPTSETVMYPTYAKWLKSYRDLPLKLNQWNNVVRWEFKHPIPFLRSREFLWQEGHSAFATKPEADEEVLTILDLYAQLYEDYLAVPVVRGRKTEKEKFAGGDYTTTVEAFISASGRAIQGATSHHLGQNFSKMFDIQVEGILEGEKTFVYQNSWGITTRTIGVMIMVHGDDKGLVLPPKIAPIQAVIVPCGITASMTHEQREKLMSECIKLNEELEDNERIKIIEDYRANNCPKTKFNSWETLRIIGDYRENYSPGWKFNYWELKGVPVRIELGPKDLEKGQVTFVRRDTAERNTCSRKEALDFLSKLLVQIQSNLFNKAKIELNEHIKQTNNWNEFCSFLDSKNLILAPFCGQIECEDRIKQESVREDPGDDPNAPSMGAKSLCIPFKQPDESIAALKKLKCIHTACQEKPKFYTLFGRSY